MSAKEMKKYSLFLIILILGISACGKKEIPPIDFMPDMQNTPAIKAQAVPMRIPPQGTLPIGYAPYPYAKDQGDLAGMELKNPLPLTKENILKGQQVYNTYCIVCHGDTGKGNGTIVPRFPMPPSLISDKVINWSDGRIYHVITMGQNLMPSYATQILPQDRWAAIQFVRALQKAVKPTEQDVDALKKAVLEGKYPFKTKKDI